MPRWGSLEGKQFQFDFRFCDCAEFWAEPQNVELWNSSFGKRRKLGSFVLNSQASPRARQRQFLTYFYGKLFDPFSVWQRHKTLRCGQLWKSTPRCEFWEICMTPLRRDFGKTFCRFFFAKLTSIKATMQSYSYADRAFMWLQRTRPHATECCAKKLEAWCAKTFRLSEDLCRVYMKKPVLFEFEKKCHVLIFLHWPRNLSLEKSKGFKRNISALQNFRRHQPCKHVQIVSLSDTSLGGAVWDKTSIPAIQTKELHLP